MRNRKRLSLGEREQDGDRTVVKKKKKKGDTPQMAKEHHLIGVLFKRSGETSLVVQRLRIHLSMQKTQLQFWVE